MFYRVRILKVNIAWAYLVLYVNFHELQHTRVQFNFANLPIHLDLCMVSLPCNHVNVDDCLFDLNVALKQLFLYVRIGLISTFTGLVSVLL